MRPNISESGTGNNRDEKKEKGCRSRHICNSPMSRYEKLMSSTKMRPDIFFFKVLLESVVLGFLTKYNRKLKLFRMSNFLLKFYFILLTFN